MRLGRRQRPAPAPSGRYRIRVEVAGFRPLVSEEQVAAGEAVDVVYRVAAETTGLEIVIEGESYRRRLKPALVKGRQQEAK